jgi:hypothetical protein
VLDKTPRLSIYNLFLTLFFVVMGAINLASFAQSDASESPQKNSKSDKNNKGEELVEEELESFRKENESAAMEFQKALSPEELLQLQEAIDRGDQAKISELTKKMSAKLQGKAGGLDKMVELSLRGFREKTPAELKNELLLKMDGTLFGPVIEVFPRSLDFIVNLFQDPVALPQLFSIPKDRKKLVIFLIVNIVLFIAAKIYKKIKKGEGAFTRWIFFFSLRMGVLFMFFKTELTPMFIVFKRTFF